MKKGIDKERDLCNYLNFNGYTVVRVAGSGAGTKRDTCDIIAGNGTDIYAIELKSSSRDNIYIKDKQVKQLIRFAKGFGAIPVIAVKFTYVGYCFLSTKDFYITDKGNYHITRDKCKKFVNKMVLT